MADENEQNQDQSDTTQTTQQPNDPPVNTPQPPGVDPSILQAYTEQLQHQSRENARLRAELEARNTAPPPPPSPEKEKEFFDKPVSTTRDLIREEIQKAIAPLNQFTAQTQRAQLIDSIKTQMRNNPAQWPYIDQIEKIFDQVIATAPQVDGNVAAAAYNTALGYFISQGGRLDAAQPANNTPTPTPTNRPVNNPPHIRPTPPAPPRPNAPQVRQLTENERKIARFNRMTDVEYLVWMGEIAGTEVAHITDDEVKARVAKLGGK